MIPNFRQFEGLNCTINTTEDCNLRCKYCYETHKTPKKIDFEKCRKFIDLIFTDPDPANVQGTDMAWIYKACVFDFIGGDSLMNPDLLDKILTYINTSWITRTSAEKFSGGWRASISSNGTLFSRKEVREFCEKWADNLAISVSIDGCPEIHDMNRVFPDGTGSMASILENWDWFRQTFPFESLYTKATCSKNTIPYLYKSLKFMHEELGLRYIQQNFIMEDTGCAEEDYQELDRQLEKCVEYVLEHRNDLYWSMLDEKEFGLPARKSNQKNYQKDFKTKGRCGSGCMPCLSIDGNIYPCFRWLPATQNGNVGVMCVGNVDEGFTQKENFSKVLTGAFRINCTRDPKCLECEYEPSCAYCIGGCYAEYGDFIRTTHICEITKLQCKWAEKYWRRYRGLSE